MKNEKLYQNYDLNNFSDKKLLDQKHIPKIKRQGDNKTQQEKKKRDCYYEKNDYNDKSNPI